MLTQFLNSSVMVIDILFRFFNAQEIPSLMRYQRTYEIPALQRYRHARDTKSLEIPPCKLIPGISNLN